MCYGKPKIVGEQTSNTQSEIFVWDSGRIFKCYYNSDIYMYKFIIFLVKGRYFFKFILVNTNKAEHSIIYSKQTNNDTVERG